MTLDEPRTDEIPAVLQRLMTQLDRRPDLPALATSLERVQRIARDAKARVQTLSAVVVNDPGLSNRLLRVANAVHYRSAGAGSIASIQRAIAVMGFETVQRLAMTVKLLDRIAHDARGNQLREDFLQAVLAGRLAAELSIDGRTEEEAHLTAMFQNLGRLLLAACLPDDALAMQRARKGLALADWSLEMDAARREHGMAPGELGAHVARGWGWPSALVQAMRRDEWPRHRPRERAQQLRWTGWIANDLARMMLEADEPEWDAACDALAEQGGTATGRTAKALKAAVAMVHPELQDLARSVGLMTTRRRVVSDGADAPAAKTAVARNHEAVVPTRLAASTPAVAASESADVPAKPAAPTSDAAPAPLPTPAAAAVRVDRVLLTREALRLTTALVGRTTRAEVPAQALDALWRGLIARRAMLWRGSEASQGYAPEVVLGQALDPQALSQWRIDPRRGRDLFSRLCAIGNEALIHDARRDEIQAHLPAAFRRHVNARRFVVLPLQLDARPLGMIYLDRDDDAPFTLDGDELQLVLALRDQTAIAIAHAA